MAATPAVQVAKPSGSVTILSQADNGKLPDKYFIFDLIPLSLVLAAIVRALKGRQPFRPSDNKCSFCKLVHFINAGTGQNLGSDAVETIPMIIGFCSGDLDAGTIQGGGDSQQP